MFTTIGWPRSARTWASKAVRSPVASSLTRRRSAASCGGTPAIGLDTCASVNGAAGLAPALSRA